MKVLHCVRNGWRLVAFRGSLYPQRFQPLLCATVGQHAAAAFDEGGTGGPCTGAPTMEDGGAQRDGGGGGEPNPPTECSELVLSPTGHAETLREYLSPGGEAVSAGFENGDDECFYDKSELPANGDGGWVKDVGSCARGGAG